VRAVLAVTLICLAVVAASCGGDDAASDGRLTVVATTTQAADLTRAVAGDRADVVQLLQPNSDPHDYEVRPEDVKALARADLVVRSGGELDHWLDGAIDSSGSDAPQLTLIDHVDTLPGDDGPDPHWWQDPRNAIRAVAALEAALARADPADARGFRTRAAAYTRRIGALDAAVARCLDRLPPAQRKLVTTHDSLGYYARRYGLDVIGAVIPSRSTLAQPSAGELARLVDTIRAAGVRAIFAESSVNPKVEQAVAGEAGARIGRGLWADSLGPRGSDGATYLGSIAANTRAIADGLSGGALRCDLPGQG
jgi:ABC-type Zn uptake system ZnuABC Zn-binding protein ZnuA